MRKDLYAKVFLRKPVLVLLTFLLFHCFAFSQTRFYLNLNATPPLSPAYNAGWNVTTGASRFSMHFVKDGSPLANYSSGSTGAAATRKCLIAQWISDPLAAQTITGTFTGQAEFLISSTGGGSTGQGFLYLRVINADGSIATEVGTCTTSNLITTLQDRNLISLALGTLNITAGQSICIDLGWNYSAGANTTRTASVSAGSSSATDLTLNDNTYTTPVENPWVQFSQTLVFLPPANDACANATLLTSGTACSNTSGNLQYAGSAAPAGACGGATAGTTYDVWYKFVATATTQTVTLSSLGSNLSALTTYMEMLSGPCGSLVSLGCQNANTRQTISGLTIGNTYYERVYVTSSPQVNPTANWNFNICVQQPPANDDCAGAISLTPGATCVNTAGTLDLATPNVATPLGCFAAGSYYDVWYSFVATTSSHTVTLSGLGANITSPQLQIYSGTCGALVSVGCVSGSNLSQTGLIPGNTYYVRVANLATNPSGLGTVANFNICITSQPPPPNDACAGATTLTSGTACSSTTSNIQYATNGTPTGACGGATSTTTFDIWFKYVATATTQTITLSNLGTNLTAASTYIEMFSGSCGSLVSLGCQAASTRQTISGLTIGNTYYVRVYVTTSPLNTTTANWNFDICVQQPPANDDCAGAISLTPGAACVNITGTLDLATPNAATPLGCFAAGTYYDVWFKFVATTMTHTVTLSSLGANITSPQIQIYSGTCGALVSVGCVSGSNLLQTGLIPGNTYYVRVANLTTNPSGLGIGAKFNICITAQAPVNDDCTIATTLTSGTTCVTTTSNLQYANTSAPAGTCGGATATTTYDVWFNYVATATTETVTLSSLGTNLTAATTYIEMFSGSCGSLVSLGCQAASTRQTISSLTIGNTYYVRVYITSAPTNATTANWNFNICIQQPPANDDCSGAISLTPGAACVTTAGTLDLATPNAATPLGCFAAGTYYDVWYNFVATTTIETVTISSLGTSFTSPNIQIYSGSCGSLVSVACASGTSLMQYGLTVGATYYVRIANLNANPSGLGTVANFNICITYITPPVNDDCSGATTLTSGIGCVNTAGTFINASPTSISLPSCGNGGSADVWYSFIAHSNRPVITLSSLGANLNTASPFIQLFSGSCGSLTQLACALSPLNTAVTPGGVGLTLNSTYYIRITTNTNTGVITAGTYTFNICVTDPPAAVVDFAKSYVNITNGVTGGTINTGDLLEIRSILVVQRPAGSGANVAIDSVAFYDTLMANKGFRLCKDSMALKTNEGKLFRPTTSTYFTDAKDADAAWITTLGPGTDTALQINMGAGATQSKRGKFTQISKPSNFGVTCIIMATYRVRVNAAYGTKIKYGGGAFRYRDSSTAVFFTINFPPDSLVVYNSLGGCLDAVSPNNIVGDEFNGTFGTTSGSPVYNQNRGVSPNTGYAYAAFGSGNGPGDYYYGVTNNTSGDGTTVQTVIKPTGSTNRVFGVWDITGDHTGAANTAKGNPPCNLNLPVSPTNPCGYMLVVNSSYRTDVAFQTNISGLCPETYYEVSAWIKNMCYKCGCDSNGVGLPMGAGYIPTAPGDSSGVNPNLAFRINGIDYYTTGDIKYQGLGGTQTGSDTLNKWLKKAFVYKTQPGETSIKITLRNNAPGGGGNDWAIDDIGIRTCYPSMTYAPSPNPTVCKNNPYTIYDTIKSYYNTYIYYKWQRSTDGGITWVDVVGTAGIGTPTWNGSAYVYVISYTLPPSATTAANNGDLYRAVVATTASNLASSSCFYSDTQPIQINIITCVILKANFLNVAGIMNNNFARVSWQSSKEEEPVKYDLQRSTDGQQFTTVAIINGNNNPTLESNQYSVLDTSMIYKKVYYRVIMFNPSGIKKYSDVIQLEPVVKRFTLFNVVNPFTNELHFNITSADKGDITVGLLDQTGRSVFNRNYIIYKGINSLTVSNIENLLTGIYILRVESKEGVFNQKIMKAQKR